MGRQWQCPYREAGRPLGVQKWYLSWFTTVKGGDKKNRERSLKVHQGKSWRVSWDFGIFLYNNTTPSFWVRGLFWLDIRFIKKSKIPTVKKTLSKPHSRKDYWVVSQCASLCCVYCVTCTIVTFKCNLIFMISLGTLIFKTITKGDLLKLPLFLGTCFYACFFFQFRNALSLLLPLSF